MESRDDVSIVKGMGIFFLPHNTMLSAPKDNNNMPPPMPGNKGKTKPTSPEAEVQEYMKWEEARECEEAAAVLATMSPGDSRCAEEVEKANCEYVLQLQVLEDEFMAEEQAAAPNLAEVHELCACRGNLGTGHGN
jgi:hypothetical protein